MLDASTTFSVPPPCSVADDAIASEPRRDELGDAAVAAICEHAGVVLTEPLDLRATVVNGVVAIAGPAADHGDHVQIGATDQDLGIARPSVLGLRSECVVARRHEGAIDDPRPAPIAMGRRFEQVCEARRDIGDDAMSHGSRDREDRRELAHRQVRTEARAADGNSSLERQLARPTATRRRGLKASDHGIELGWREAGDRGPRWVHVIVRR